MGNWTPDEDKIIKEYYPSETLNQLKNRLSGRSIEEIAARASKLRIRKKNAAFTVAEDNLLRQYCNTDRAKLESIMPDRSKDDIAHRALVLGILRKGNKQ